MGVMDTILAESAVIGPFNAHMAGAEVRFDVPVGPGNLDLAAMLSVFDSKVTAIKTAVAVVPRPIIVGLSKYLWENRNRLVLHPRRAHLPPLSLR